MAYAAWLLIALAVVAYGGFARVTVDTVPPGAGYLVVTTPDGYPLPTVLVQGTEIRVTAVPRGCFELDRIEVRTDSGERVFRESTILLTLEGYQTEVVAYFRGYPEGARCPYVSLEAGPYRLKIYWDWLLIPLLAVAGGASSVLVVRAIRGKVSYPDLRPLVGRINERSLIRLWLKLCAARSVLEGDPLVGSAYLQRSSGRAAEIELENVLLSFAGGQGYQIVRLSSLPPVLVQYALREGLVPVGRKDAERLVKETERMIGRRDFAGLEVLAR